MKEKFIKLENKTAFLEMISFKLNLAPSTLHRQLYSDTVSKRNVKRIEKAIDLQLNCDFKKIELQKKYDNLM